MFQVLSVMHCVKDWYLKFSRCSSELLTSIENRWKDGVLKLKFHIIERRIHFWLDETKLHSLVVMICQNESGFASHCYRATIRMPFIVHFDCDPEHMLGWVNAYCNTDWCLILLWLSTELFLGEYEKRFLKTEKTNRWNWSHKVITKLSYMYSLSKCMHCITITF